MNKKEQRYSILAFQIFVQNVILESERHNPM